MSKFEIEAGVPIPPRKGGGGGRRGSKYPFADMEPGHSFLVDGEVKVGTVRSAVAAFMKRNKDFGKFAVRTTDEGVRVWRAQ